MHSLKPNFTCHDLVHEINSTRPHDLSQHPLIGSIFKLALNSCSTCAIIGKDGMINVNNRSNLCTGLVRKVTI